MKASIGLPGAGDGRPDDLLKGPIASARADERVRVERLRPDDAERSEQRQRFECPSHDVHQEYHLPRINSMIPFTMAFSAQPGFRRDVVTS